MDRKKACRVRERLSRGRDAIHHRGLKVVSCEMEFQPLGHYPVLTCPLMASTFPQVFHMAESRSMTCGSTIGEYFSSRKPGPRALATWYQTGRERGMFVGSSIVMTSKIIRR
jgi:hypothetical protein